VAAWLVGLGGIAALAIFSWKAAAIVVAVFVVVFGGAWLVSPWSRTARNLVLPDRATFDRRVANAQRIADALGRVPLFGSLWRLAQRVTKPLVDGALAQQRDIIEEESQRRRDD
jgi:membrane protein implicated in regulation of membrane protease activity